MDGWMVCAPKEGWGWGIRSFCYLFAIDILSHLSFLLPSNTKEMWLLGPICRVHYFAITIVRMLRSKMVHASGPDVECCIEEAVEAFTTHVQTLLLKMQCRSRQKGAPAKRARPHTTSSMKSEAEKWGYCWGRRPSCLQLPTPSLNMIQCVSNRLHGFFGALRERERGRESKRER